MRSSHQLGADPAWYDILYHTLKLSFWDDSALQQTYSQGEEAVKEYIHSEGTKVWVKGAKTGLVLGLAACWFYYLYKNPGHRAASTSAWRAY